MTVPLFLWLGFALFALGVVLLGAAIGGGGGASALFSGVIMLVVTLPELAFGRLRISVDWRGLKVVTWIMGISLKTIPLNAVMSVHTTRNEPLQWGGWGYRIRPGSSAIILRTGPGLVVTLTPQESRRAERCRSATDRHNVLVSAGVHGSVKPYDTTFLRVDRHTSEDMRVDLVLKPHKNLIPLA